MVSVYSVNTKENPEEDLSWLDTLKTLPVEGLTASLVKVRKAACSSGGGAGLEDLKSQKGEDNKLEIKPRSRLISSEPLGVPRLVLDRLACCRKMLKSQ